MNHQSHRNEAGQSIIEYSLLLGLLVLIAVSGLAAIGPLFDTLDEGFAGAKMADVAPSPATPRYMDILGDYLRRIAAFQAQNGRWPRSWGDFAFTDIGLNPDDWDETVEGIRWNPHGRDVGLANRTGDNIQIYVNDMHGNTLHLVDGWNIWCTTGGKCYFHHIAPETEVDINTLVVRVEES